MNLSEIAPTKTNLLSFKDQLSFSKNGHSLLEQKREVLVHHLIDIISRIKEHRTRLNDLLEKSYTLLKMFEIEIGEFELLRIMKGIKVGYQVDIQERSIMGVTIPSIRKKKKVQTDNEPPISLSSTTLTYDRLFSQIREIMELLLVVAQTEVSAWRLSYEIKKTQRRVNALENVFIPQFEEVVKYIQDTLEERERETFFQMKRIKSDKEQESQPAEEV